jgi:hypothetical protein
MARAGKAFSVDTHPTKEVVVNGLTRDATVQACIFDLIDNAIDAARDTIFLRHPSAPQDELPDNYNGYKVDITLNGAEFRIEDNCGGIPVDKLKKLVLRFGERSRHSMGIGSFGVGLNRALFKLGRTSHLKTDTGKQRAEMLLDVDTYLKDEKSWDLPAHEFTSSGRVGTEIEIKQLPDEIAREFADRDWENELHHAIGRRYGRFIAKNLKVSVNGTSVKNEEVKIRENPPVEYEGEYKFYKTKDGVSIHLKYGQHKDHRFSNEQGYDRDRNATLTSQYGWNAVCNDRAILIADQSRKTGWDTKLHSEHYGFVGFVDFVGDPDKLPWNTTKTDIDLNNEAYALALKDMRQFAEKWRAMADKRKKTKAKPRKLPPKTTARPSKSRKPLTKKSKPGPVIKIDHNEFRTVLPNEVNEQFCDDKHLALVHEAKLLDLADLTYSGLAVIRMLFETSAIAYLARNAHYEEYKKFAISKNERGLKRKMNADEKKKYQPRIDDLIPFFHNHPELWGAAKQNHLKHSLANMGKYQPRLNSVLHNPFQAINRSEAFQIRDEVLPLLRHLIET